MVFYYVYYLIKLNKKPFSAILNIDLAITDSWLKPVDGNILRLAKESIIYVQNKTLEMNSKTILHVIFPG